MKLNHILGLNARSQHFTFQSNTREGKRIAKSKILTAKHLKKLGIPTPRIYKKFFKPEHIMDFDWKQLPSSFALKPSKGLGGGGIIVIKRKSKDGKFWTTTNKEKLTIDDMKLHVLDILEGAFSIGSVPDSAFIQEYVGRHKAFTRYAYRGTPDIRVIVFNKVPVMAMLRLPTKESGGRANLHQGAVGVGIDIATGVTTKAIWHGEPIKYKPDSDRKLTGVKIPQWTKILETAAKSAEIPGLGYMGVDIVLHPERGPMVLEVNSQPGLQIQLANLSGLKKRLERVDDLDVQGFEQGVRIAKALFADKEVVVSMKAEEGIQTVTAVQEITLRGENKKKMQVMAKLDTGAWRTSISRDIAEDLGLLKPGNILWEKRVQSSLGLERRPIILLTFVLAGRKITTDASVAQRASLKYPMIVGRKNLKGFLIDPGIRYNKKNRV